MKTPVHEHWTSRAVTVAADQCVVMTGALDAAAAARVEGLVDNLEAAGVPVVAGRSPAAGVINDVLAPARTAGLLMLAGLAPTPELDAIIAARRQAGLMTAVDLSPHDLEPDDLETGAPEGAGEPAALTASAASLADACDLVVSPAGALHSAAAASGRRALVLPTLLTRARAAALRDARAAVDPTGILVIGWRLGGAGHRPPDYAAAVADGLLRILAEHRDRIEILGEIEFVPEPLRAHDRVTVLAGGDVDAETIARWSVHVWTPAVRGTEIVDDARLLEEASCAGVASVLPADARGGVDGYVSPFVLVESVDLPDDWYDALHHALDDPGVRARRAQEAARRADALDGPAASKAVVSRLMGLARYRAERVV